MRRMPYSTGFFDDLAEATRTSAEEIVPLVVDLLAPRSVVDLGCGRGTWLAAFARAGVDDYLGVDGSWVSMDALEIPADRFVAARLDRPFAYPRVFDLAVSLEVGEHLPASSAAGYVESLCALAPCVLFSAAIPNQGGHRHVNEQWPEYWAKLFSRHGYEPIDAFRQHVWLNPHVAWWYQQNVLLYVAQDSVSAKKLSECGLPVSTMLSIVHPEVLSNVAAERDANSGRRLARDHSLADLVTAFPPVALRSLRWRMGRLKRVGRRRSRRPTTR